MVGIVRGWTQLARAWDVEDQEDKLFRDEMRGVARLRSPARVALARGEDSPLARDARRAAAVAALERDTNFLSSECHQLLDPWYPLEYRREGVQLGVFKKLKQGRYQVDARLDLHRMTVEQARTQVFDFLRQARAYDLRTVMIVHGKGTHSGSPAAILKSFVNQWLPAIDEVQAYASAQPRDGGLGAVYVLLRKGDKARQANRERVTKGRPGV